VALAPAGRWWACIADLDAGPRRPWAVLVFMDWGSGAKLITLCLYPCQTSHSRCASVVWAYLTSTSFGWPFICCTNPDQMWASFRFLIDHNAQDFFDASVIVEVRDGACALFWEDNWLTSCSIKSLSPNLWVAISPRVRCSPTVKDALSVGPHGLHWVTNVMQAQTV
jgi:hypothetical protein